MSYSVHGPITFVGGTVMFGAYFNVLRQITPEIEVGGEAGVLYGSEGDTIMGTDYSVSMLTIPVVAKGLYNFKIPSAPTLAPYAGVSLGLGITSVSTSETVFGQDVGGSSTGVVFQVHGGARFGEKKNLVADLRLGSMDGGFVFGPTIGYQF